MNLESDFAKEKFKVLQKIDNMDSKFKKRKVIKYAQNANSNWKQRELQLQQIVYGFIVNL